MRYTFLILAFTLLSASYSFSQVLITSVSGGEVRQGTSVLHWKLGGFTGSYTTDFQLLGFPILIQDTQVNSENEQTESNNLFYPNPFTSELNIQLQNKETEMDITIYDVTGTAIKTFTHVVNSLSVKMPELPDGIYLCRCTNSRTHEIIDTQKIIKIH